MPELFRLIEEKFNEVHQEQQWTYLCLFDFIFKKRVIKRITITDHPWRKKEREWMTKELVLNILTKELNERKEWDFIKNMAIEKFFLMETDFTT